MFKTIFLFLFLTTFFYGNDTQVILNEIKGIKEDVKLLREDMNKRFEQTDKEIEQMDKRIEQMDKRIDFLQNVLLVVLAGVMASPFLVEYMARKREEFDRKAIEESKKVIIVLRELASRDENVAKAMKIAGIE